MKVKTCDLTGRALDWAAAQAKESNAVYRLQNYELPCLVAHDRYSEDWRLAGPIIEEVGIDLMKGTEPSPYEFWEASIHETDGCLIQYGDTPIIAAMRCFVASKLGDTVDIPDELV